MKLNVEYYRSLELSASYLLASLMLIHIYIYIFYLDNKYHPEKELRNKTLTKTSALLPSSLDLYLGHEIACLTWGGTCHAAGYAVRRVLSRGLTQVETKASS